MDGLPAMVEVQPAARVPSRRRLWQWATLILCAIAGVSVGIWLNARNVHRQEWPSHGGDSGETRFAPATQINRDNVQRLGLAWEYEFDTDRGQQATPIIVDGTLYTVSAWSKVYAFDAGTGRPLWSYDPEVPHATLAKGCCDAVSRGVAVHDGKVLVATLDGRLIALDQRNGHPLWSVVTVDQSKAYTITGAPRIVKDLVLIGNAGAEFGVRGYVTAYSVSDGRQKWRFYTVPNADGKADGAASDAILRSKANSTWFGDKWKQTGGGGTVWDAIVYDPETDLVFIGVGNGSPHSHLIRSNGRGDNLFLSSIVALRPDTGEYVWHYQTTPGDSWDYTATQPIILTELTIAGQRRKVLMQAPKNGFFYVLDRETGALISAKNYVEMNWAKGVDPKSGRPIEVPEARFRDKPFYQLPGSLGAHSWHPMAYSPDTGLVYIPTQMMGQLFTQQSHYIYRPHRMNLGLDLATSRFPDDPASLDVIKAVVYGELVAWDPVTQQRKWTVRHPYFLNGGVLATAGGLVFQGDAGGRFSAYDAMTGKERWSYQLNNGVVAPPVSYVVDDVQYIALMVGYGGPAAMLGTIVPDAPRKPGRLMVFKLDGKLKSSAVIEADDRPLPDLRDTRSSGNVAAGQITFNQNCLVCHGISARSGFNADLRRSGVLSSPDLWRDVVIGGLLSANGMASFCHDITPTQAEDVRAFVIREAQVLVHNAQAQAQAQAGKH